jgi:hypothetical protein
MTTNDTPTPVTRASAEPDPVAEPSAAEAMRERARYVLAALRCVNYPRKVVTVGDAALATNGDPMDNWPLAQYGFDDSRSDYGVQVHVTTDRVRASETRGTATDDAEWDAQSPTLAAQLALDILKLLDPTP